MQHSKSKFVSKFGFRVQVVILTAASYTVFFSFLCSHEFDNFYVQVGDSNNSVAFDEF